MKRIGEVSFRRNQILPTILFNLFMINFLCIFLIKIDRSIFYLSNAIVCVFIIIYMIFKYKKMYKYIFLFIVIDLVCFISSFLIKNTNFTIILYLLIYQIFALFLINNKELLSWFKFYLIVVYVLFFYYMASNIDPNTILNEMSSNGISIIVLFLLIFHCIHRLYKEKKPSVLPTMAAWIIIFWASGRGGLLAICVFTIGILIVYKPEKILQKALKNFFLILLIIFGFFLLVENTYMHNEILNVINRFSNDTPRFLIWETYINKAKTNSLYLWLGVPYNTSSVFIEMENNMHSILFNIHARFGIIPLIIFLYFFIKVNIIYFKKKMYYYNVFLMTLFIRSLTDNTSFIDCFDFLWYYVILYGLALQSKQKKRFNIKILGRKKC